MSGIWLYPQRSSVRYRHPVSLDQAALVTYSAYQRIFALLVVSFPVSY